MEQFEILSVQQCEEINGDGILSGAAGGILGFMVGTVASAVKWGVTGNDKGVAQIMLSCTSVGTWAGAGFPLP